MTITVLTRNSPLCVTMHVWQSSYYTKRVSWRGRLVRPNEAAIICNLVSRLSFDILPAHWLLYFTANKSDRYSSSHLNQSLAWNVFLLKQPNISLTIISSLSSWPGASMTVCQRVNVTPGRANHPCYVWTYAIQNSSILDQNISITKSCASLISRIKIIILLFNIISIFSHF